jgi:NitT/TauT family transport system substrate-binding protein
MFGHSVSRSSRRPGRRWFVRSARAVTLGVAVAVLAACGGGGGSADSESGGGVDEVTFLNILPMESLTFTPEMVADACGHFRRQNLDVSFETTQGSAPAMQSIIAGSALLARVGDIETILAAGDKGAPVTNVGTVQQLGSIRLVSSSRAPIDSPEDFRGKLIGIPSEGGTSEITLDLVLAAGGVPAEDVERQVVGLTPAVFSLVESGRIDAYVVSLDVAIALQQQQPNAVIYDPSKDIDSGSQLYLTSREAADDAGSQDQMRRYLRAIASAIRFVAKDEANGFAETMKCISSKYDVATLEDESVARRSLSAYVASWTAHGSGALLRTDPQQWTSSYDELAAAGMVEEGMNPDDWYTNDFVPEMQ